MQEGRSACGAESLQLALVRTDISKISCRPIKLDDLATMQFLSEVDESRCLMATLGDKLVVTCSQLQRLVDPCIEWPMETL